ncbi:hypothetical protein L1049_016702 [Liquidambar formosana]|uniref:MSP domain-containing protein n=1 Tax=Liquidambar formosana TaxID=63359 RepID=A0AAP0S0B0_LIQFO
MDSITLQAQRQAPTDKCKDKFLIQSTVVPFGTTEEEITSDMFAKDSGKYIEEKKLRVVLISPPNSPVLLPANGMLKQDPCYETPMQKDKVLSGVENIPPPDKVAKDEGFKTSKDVDELRTAKDVESRPNEDVEDLKLVKNVMDSKLSREFEELKLKRSVLESRLHEAELTIMKLAEERSIAAREKEMLKQELAVLRQKKGDVRRVHVGFPFLFVCMVAIISLALGYLMRS